MGSLAAVVLAARLVPTVPQAAIAPIPTPESTLGFAPCADYKLATYEQIAEYFRRLDDASDRLQLVEIGTSTEGRPQLMAVISSERNLAQLARFKQIARSLALARDGNRPLSEEAARLLVDEGKVVVWIDFGLHSTEVGHAQTAPLVAYQVVQGDSEEMTAIRDQAILLLVPNMNPDGTTMVANWYMTYVGTPFELSLPPMLYHKYAGHDNNRDWFMFNQRETRNAAKQLYHEWFPQIVYDQHQSGPFPSRMFVPPFEDPVNPMIPPLVIRGVNLVGDTITRRLDQEGKRGAISRIGFDTWWNGGMRTAPYFHNMIGILTETGHASATPAHHDARTFPTTFANGVPTLEPTADYPSPYLGGDWHLRDSCDYMVTASMAVLDIAAKHRREWLADSYRMASDATAPGSETYVASADQWDRGTAVKMVNVLRLGGVEVERALTPFTAAGRMYPSGSFLVRAAQPFRAGVRDLLNPQVYPDLRLFPGGPPKRPYDITGWTLPYQMGVKVDRIAEPISVGTEPVDTAAAPSGSVASAPKVAYAIDPRTNDAFIAVNRLLGAGEVVFRATAPLEVGSERWPAGTFLIGLDRDVAPQLERLARTLGLTIAGVDQAPRGVLRLRRPRVGLYRAYGDNPDEGWTRWLLEQFEFSYTSVGDAEIRAGNLGAKYDVLLLPAARYETMLNGLSPGSVPPEYTGGMTPQGVANLYDFTAGGGTLVAMDHAAELPLATFGLPVRDVAAGRRDADFYVPGTIVRVKMDTTHPVAFGMPPEAAAVFVHSPVFGVGPSAGGPPAQSAASAAEVEGLRVIAEYPSNNLLMSGWLLGGQVLAHRAAVVEARVEGGRVILLGFRTQHRGQPHGTFKLLFNSLYHSVAETSSLVAPR